MPEGIESTTLNWKNGTSMNTTNNTCAMEHSIDYWLFSTLYIVVFILGLPVNCIALYAACKQVRRKNELGVYLFNLSLADLLYILTLPFWIDFTVQHDNWRAGPTMCQICSFLTSTNLYASAAFLCCISFDRYLGVVHPLCVTRARTVQAAAIISCLVWVIQSAFNLELLIERETENIADHNLCYDIYPIEPWKAMLNYFRIAFGFLLPFALLLTFYWRIYNSLRGSIATGDHEKRKAIQLMLSIIVGFTICFTPYHAILLARSILESGNCTFAKSIFIPYRLSVALVCLNCIMDPVLYCFISETSRRDILLFTLRRKGKSTKGVRKLQRHSTLATTIL
ncbi:ovarian cancer G-protein coupled receptor 1-like isoform X2 [Heterodontus francisci]|uniref:ovarian cancer G-protein coupled receptor 1-like isoform X2 n=1 Tax=Heterodontus francisci TaxID=7792 RepID=UPI00355ACF01